jgi:type IV secretion system protein VirB9
MSLSFRFYAFVLTVAALAGCASQGTPPPRISLDEPVQAQALPEPPKPVEVVEVPKVLPMPGQMKSLSETKPAPEPADETVRVSRANAQARIAPTREGYVNAIQVWPYTDGALYQVYAAPERVTVISLQPGEELVTVAAGDTVRWIVGDTSSGSGSELHVNVLVKPIRSGLKTNLVITTSRRTYLLELTSTGTAWMASVSWEYPKDKILALQHQAQALPEPPKPVEVVEVPKVLPMPGQMKSLLDTKPTPEPADETVRVARANAQARIAPTREGYVNGLSWSRELDASEGAKP